MVAGIDLRDLIALGAVVPHERVRRVLAFDEKGLFVPWHDAPDLERHVRVQGRLDRVALRILARQELFLPLVLCSHANHVHR